VSRDKEGNRARSIGSDVGVVRILDEQHIVLPACDASGHGISSAPVVNRDHPWHSSKEMSWVPASTYTVISRV